MLENFEIYEKMTSETPIIYGQNAYFTCPSCQATPQQKKFSFNINKGSYNCFKCGSTAINIASDIISQFYKKDNHLTYTKVATKRYEPKKEENKETKNYYLLDKNTQNKINSCLEDLFNYLEVLPKHKELFKEKKGFELFFNAKSTNKLKEFIKNCVAPEGCFYGKHKLDILKMLGLTRQFIQNNDLIISFFKNHKNNFIAYQTYDIQGLTDVKRMLITNYSAQAYGLENLLIDSDYYFICESVEKLECLKAYGFNGIALTGINNGISSLDYIINEPIFQNKKFIISFDTKKSLFSEEMKSAINLAKFLHENNIECFISSFELTLNSPIKDLDIDGYLLTIKDKNKKIQEIQKLITNKKTIEDIENFRNIEKENETVFKKRNTDKIDKKIYTPEFTTIEKVRSELPEKLKSFASNYHDIYNKNSYKYLIVKAPAGSGKTHSLLELIKHRVNTLKEQRVLYITNNKNLIKEVFELATNENIKTKYIKSISDVCLEHHNTNINKLEPTDMVEGKFVNYETLKLLLEKNFDYSRTCVKCKIFTDCKISEIKNPDFKQYNENLFLCTLDKVLANNQLISNLKPQILIFDEDLINKLTKNIEISEYTVKNLKKLLKDENITQDQIKVIHFIEALINDIKASEQDRLSLSETNELISKYYGLKEFLKEVNVKELNFDNEIVHGKDLKFLENKYILNDFIDCIKKKNVYIQDKKIILGVKQKLQIKGIPTIFLDASGSKELIEKYFNIEPELIDLYEPKLLHKNLVINQNIDFTFNKQQIIKSVNQKKNKDAKFDHIVNFIDKNIFPNDKVLIVANKQLIELFENKFNASQVKFLNYGNIRGLNEYGNYNKMFLFNNSINYTAIELKAKLLFNITDFEKKLKFVDTNILDQNRMVQIENIQYRNKTINELLKLNREAEIYQSIARIYRDFNTKDKKQVYYFSDIVLSDFIHEPINRFSIEEIRERDKTKRVKALIRKDVRECLNKFNCFSYLFYLNTDLENLENLKLEKNIYSSNFEKVSEYKEYYSKRLDISLRSLDTYFNELVSEFDLKTFTYKTKNQIKPYYFYASDKQYFDNLINIIEGKQDPTSLINNDIDTNIKENISAIGEPEGIENTPEVNITYDFDLDTIMDIRNKLTSNELKRFDNLALYRVIKDHEILPADNFYIKYPEKKEYFQEIITELLKDIHIKTDLEGTKQAIEYLTCYTYKNKQKDISNLYYVLDRELSYLNLSLPEGVKVNDNHEDLLENTENKGSNNKEYIKHFDILALLKLYKDKDVNQDYINKYGYFRLLQRLENKKEYYESCINLKGFDYKYYFKDYFNYKNAISENIDFLNDQLEDLIINDHVNNSTLELLEKIINDNDTFEFTCLIFHLYQRVKELNFDNIARNEKINAYNKPEYITITDIGSTEENTINEYPEGNTTDIKKNISAIGEPDNIKDLDKYNIFLEILETDIIISDFEKYKDLNKNIYPQLFDMNVKLEDYINFKDFIEVNLLTDKLYNLKDRFFKKNSIKDIYVLSKFIKDFEKYDYRYFIYYFLHKQLLGNSTFKFNFDTSNIELKYRNEIKIIEHYTLNINYENIHKDDKKRINAKIEIDKKILENFLNTYFNDFLEVARKIYKYRKMENLTKALKLNFEDYKLWNNEYACLYCALFILFKNISAIGEPEGIKDLILNSI